MLILDEPTNHLDVDAREALVQALNSYTGAVVLVSHDRHMLELTADRLVLVDEGTAREFDGSMDDYIALVLGTSGKAGGGKGRKLDKKAAQQAREKSAELKRTARAAEDELARLTAEKSAVDRATFDPAGAEPRFATLTMSELMKRGSDLATRIAAAEARWLEASEAIETVREPA